MAGPFHTRPGNRQGAGCSLPDNSTPRLKAATCGRTSGSGKPSRRRTGRRRRQPCPLSRGRTGQRKGGNQRIHFAVTAGWAKHLVLIVTSKADELEKVTAFFAFEFMYGHLEFPCNKKVQAGLPANRPADRPAVERDNLHGGAPSAFELSNFGATAKIPPAPL